MNYVKKVWLVLVMSCFALTAIGKIDYAVTAFYPDHSPYFMGVAEVKFENTSSKGQSKWPFWIPANTYSKKHPFFSTWDPVPENTFLIDSLIAYQGGVDFKIERDQKHPQVIWVHLPKPLPPGKSLVISFEFMVEVKPNPHRSMVLELFHPILAGENPDLFSPNYALPAHLQNLPNAQFNVRLRIPKNYRIAGGGNMSNPEEWHWLSQVHSDTENFIDAFSELSSADKVSALNRKTIPPSEAYYKRIVFNLNKGKYIPIVADKRLNVLVYNNFGQKERLKVVTMFQNQFLDYWMESPSIIAKAIPIIEKELGPFPINQISIVDGSMWLKSPKSYKQIGFTAYPKGKYGFEVEIYRLLIEQYLLHSRHFFDFSQSPWLLYGTSKFLADELASGKSNLNLNSFLSQLRGLRLNLDDFPIDYPLQAKTHDLLESQTQKVAMAFHMANASQVPGTFKRALIRAWRFGKADTVNIDYLTRMLEYNLEADFAWLFTDLFQENILPDYTIELVQGNSVWVRNEIETPFPFFIQGFKNGNPIAEKWFQGHSGLKEIKFLPGDYDRIELNLAPSCLELNTKGNRYFLENNNPRSRPLQVQFLGRETEPLKNQVFYAPMLRYNTYDRLSLGLAVYNSVMPLKSISYSISPEYSFGHSTLVGRYRLRYRKPYPGPQRGLQHHEYRLESYHGPQAKRYILNRIHYSFGYQAHWEAPTRYSFSITMLQLQWRDLGNEETQPNTVNLIRAQAEMETRTNLGSGRFSSALSSDFVGLRWDFHGIWHYPFGFYKNLNHQIYLGLTYQAADRIKIDPTHSKDLFFDDYLFHRFQHGPQYLEEKGRFTSLNDSTQAFGLAVYSLNIRLIKHVELKSQIGSQGQSFLYAHSLTFRPFPEFLSMHFPCIWSGGDAWSDPNYLSRIRIGLNLDLDHWLEKGSKRLFY